MDNKQKIYELLGEVSMCWTELPKGIFRSERVLEIANEIDALYHRDCGKCIYLVHTPDSVDCCIGCKWSSQDRYKEADK